MPDDADLNDVESSQKVSARGTSAIDDEDDEEGHPTGAEEVKCSSQ
jgi:hypothetical protein